MQPLHSYRCTSMMRDQPLGGRAGGSTAVDARTGCGTLRNLWVVQTRFTGASSAAGPTKVVAQSRAIGQATPSQPDFSPGQQGMSSCISIAVICVETDDAMALGATPMLRGPKMIPSRADSNSSRWMIVTNLMRLSWHGAAAVGRGAMKMCRHVVPPRIVASDDSRCRQSSRQRLSKLFVTTLRRWSWFAERQHQAVCPVEEGSAVDGVGDLEVVETL